MKVDKFIKKHKAGAKEQWISYCEAFITPDGEVHEARPSHDEWLVQLEMETTGKTRDEVKASIPIDAGVTNYFVEKHGLIALWYTSILAAPFTMSNEKMYNTVKELVNANILSTSAIRNITWAKDYTLCKDHELATPENLKGIKDALENLLVKEEDE